MHPGTKLFFITVFLLFAGILIAGCSGNGGSSNTTAVTTTGVSVTTTGPLFTPGDIVMNPSSSSRTTAWLILSYDPSTDMYERAFIYSNPDGSWGYRENSNTEQAERSVMEKVYTEKVDHVDPASVPTSPPTTAATPTVISTTTTFSETSVTTATTTAITGAPYIRDVEPDTGIAGNSVSITDISGQNFNTAASVKLSKAGNPDIVATNVVVSSPTDLTCILPLPGNATAGSWDLVVTNPDGQYYNYTNIFLLHGNPNPVSSSSGGSYVVTGMSVSPTFVASGGGAVPIARLTITGSNIPTTGIEVVLRRSSSPDIVGSSIYFPGVTTLQVSFSIPAGSQGTTWDVDILSSDGTTILGSLPGGFAVN